MYRIEVFRHFVVFAQYLTTFLLYILELYLFLKLLKWILT